MRKTEAVTAIARIVSDALMALAAFTVAYFLRMHWYEFNLFEGLQTVQLFPAPATLFPFSLYAQYALQFTVVLVLVLAIQGRYRLGADEKLFDELQQTFWGIAASMALLLGYFFFAQEYFFSRLIFGLAWLLTLVFVWGGRFIIRAIKSWVQSFGVGVRRVLLLGDGDLAEKVLQQSLKKPAIEIVGILTAKKALKKQWNKRPVWGSFGQLRTILEKKPLDEVWLAAEQITSRQKAQLVSQSHIHHKKFRFFPDELGLDLAALKVSNFGSLPIITLLNSPLHGWWAVIKRGVDFALSALALIILSPVLFLVGLAVFFTDPKAPILYVSKRVGAAGKLFNCYKFRSMVVDAEAQKAQLLKKNQRKGGVLFKLEDDPRVTKLGKFLRKSSLDELPQLWNVLRGDMSLVGPRPHLEAEVAQYPDHDRELLLLRPGLTGLAQINGRSSLSFRDEMKHEMFYLKNWSLWLDIIVIIKTAWMVVRGDNAS